MVTLASSSRIVRPLPTRTEDHHRIERVLSQLLRPSLLQATEAMPREVLHLDLECLELRLQILHTAAQLLGLGIIADHQAAVAQIMVEPTPWSLRLRQMVHLMATALSVVAGRRAHTMAMALTVAKCLLGLGARVKELSGSLLRTEDLSYITVST